MGMIGTYISLEEPVIKQLEAGEGQLYDMNVWEMPNLDIDKAWGLLNYLLCGSLGGGEPPLGYIVPMISAQHLEFEDGAAFYLHPEQVMQASQAMQTLGEQQLRERYDFAALMEAEIYPLTDNEDKEEIFNYINQNYLAIRSYYDEAVSKRRGIVFYIN